MNSKQILKELTNKQKDQLFALTFKTTWISDDDFLASRDFSAWLNKHLLLITGKDYKIKNDGIANAIIQGLTK